MENYCQSHHSQNQSYIEILFHIQYRIFSFISKFMASQRVRNCTFVYGQLWPWWRHQIETFSALLVICANSSVTGEFPTQRPMTRSIEVFFDLRPNKLLSKQSWGWWFDTPSRPLWHQCDVSSFVENVLHSALIIFHKTKRTIKISSYLRRKHAHLKSNSAKFTTITRLWHTSLIGKTL